MTDNPNNNDTPETEEDETEPTSPQTQNSEHMIPKSRLDEVIKERNKLRKQIEQDEQSRKESEQQRLEKQQEYKELYEQTKAELEALQMVKAKADSYSQKLTATNDLRIERLPDNIKALMPKYDDPVQVSEWLDVAEQNLPEDQKPKAPNLDAGSGSGGGSRATQGLAAGVQNAADIARRFGYSVNEDQVAEYARRPRQQQTPLTTRQNDKEK